MGQHTHTHTCVCVPWMEGQGKDRPIERTHAYARWRPAGHAILRVHVRRAAAALGFKETGDRFYKLARSMMHMQLRTPYVAVRIRIRNTAPVCSSCSMQCNAIQSGPPLSLSLILCLMGTPRTNSLSLSL